MTMHEGLATYLVLYTDTTGAEPTTEIAYIDQYSEESAREEVLSWEAGDDAGVIDLLDVIIPQWERAGARRCYLANYAH